MSPPLETPGSDGRSSPLSRAAVVGLLVAVSVLPTALIVANGSWVDIHGVHAAVTVSVFVNQSVSGPLPAVVGTASAVLLVAGLVVGTMRFRRRA